MPSALYNRISIRILSNAQFLSNFLNSTDLSVGVSVIGFVEFVLV